MIIETRKTAQGTEYWDNDEKRSLFVPAGEKPNFEVTENPNSMIMGMDLANSKDVTAVNGKVIDAEINLDNMNAEQLLSFAKQNDIDVPGKLKKEETIREFIVEQLTTDAQ
ncbi:hypothetical protein [Bacillus sp. JJ722]|uniref:hypothetical protein n=1 Tax=Bacillus sp. JJ722 TaxID=3122973 RepID=UPI002FFECE55